MKNIDDKISVLITENELKKRISELANQISNDYFGKKIYMICILNGASYFTIDLSKKIPNKIVLSFMKVSSYGDSTISSGKIDIKLDITEDIKNKDVIIVEDIIDTGNTLTYLYDYIKQKSPSSIKICTLLDKKARREKDISADYVGFEIDDKFILGYGLDYKGEYRNLPYIGYVE